MPETSLVPETSELTLSSFRLLPTGLEPVGSPSFDDWITAGDFINKSEKAVHFWIGDWLNYGERTWGDRYEEALKRTKYDYQTLRNDKWVASRVPPDRRKPELSFAHHADVANLPADEQDDLLAKAVSEQLNREKFRKVVRDQGLPLQDQDVSRRRDNQTPVQELIDSMLATERLVTHLETSGLTQEEKDALLKMGRDLSHHLKRFLTKLNRYEDADETGL